MIICTFLIFSEDINQGIKAFDFETSCFLSQKFIYISNSILLQLEANRTDKKSTFGKCQSFVCSIAH